MRKRNAEWHGNGEVLLKLADSACEKPPGQTEALYVWMEAEIGKEQASGPVR